MIATRHRPRRNRPPVLAAPVGWGAQVAVDATIFSPMMAVPDREPTGPGTPYAKHRIVLGLELGGRVRRNTPTFLRFVRRVRACQRARWRVPGTAGASTAMDTPAKDAHRWSAASGP